MQNGVQKVVISTSYGHMTVIEMRAIIIVVVISLRISGIHTWGGQKSLIPFQFHLPHNID